MQKYCACLDTQVVSEWYWQKFIFLQKPPLSVFSMRYLSLILFAGFLVFSVDFATQNTELVVLNYDLSWVNFSYQSERPVFVSVFFSFAFGVIFSVFYFFFFFTYSSSIFFSFTFFLFFFISSSFILLLFLFFPFLCFSSSSYSSSFIYCFSFF